ncbi:MAG TPA: type 1 glutamine amidotransferase [Gammaproteobacteria bacterium]|nr:type 1 glutamine amidotransferase [Gammaproteobacteria bacterium]
MKPIRIFRHIACEGPGYFGTFLEKHNIPFELVRIDAGETPPDTIDDISGLVFMGGPMSVNDDLPWIPQELALIRQAVDTGLPVLGHCLGGQLISKALGGEISANPVKEIGWLPVQKIPGPQADHWLEGFTDNTELFHWHGETFSIPEGASAILRSEHCDHQGFVIGNTLALQCHVEMTGEMVDEWATLYSDELNNPAPTVQDQDEITRNLDERVKRLQAVADALYLRWLQPVSPGRDN